LKQNTTVTSIDLEYNRIGDASRKAVQDAVEYQPPQPPAAELAAAVAADPENATAASLLAASVAEQAALLEKARGMKQQKEVRKTCQSCERTFQKAGEPRSPLVFDCLCVFCADCAATEEAKHLAVNDGATVADGIPCFDCKRPRTTPISKLKFSRPHIAAAIKDAKAVPPLCDLCGDEDDAKQATKFCPDCPRNQRLCDDCFAFQHRSGSRKTHSSVTIEEHLSSVQGGSQAATATADLPECRTHAGQPLQVFCDTCNVLVCAMCAVLEHNRHEVKPIAEATDEHKAMIEMAVANTVAVVEESKEEVSKLQAAQKQVIVNKETALKEIDGKFNQLRQQFLQHWKARRERLKKVVEDAVERKEALLSAHEEMLDDIDTFAGNSVQLVMNTLDISTQAEVLQMKKVFLDGLGHFKQQGEVSLDDCCGGLDIDVNFDAAFDDAFGDMLTGLDDFGLVGVTLPEE